MITEQTVTELHLDNLEHTRLDRVMASELAKDSLQDVSNIQTLLDLSLRKGVSKILIDFKLNVDVIVGMGSNESKADLTEEVEFIPGLSRIRSILELYDLSFIIISKGEVKFKRSKFYRPLLTKCLH